MKVQPQGALPVGADQRRQLLAAARPQLDNRRQMRNVRENRSPMGREQLHFSARDLIPRQKTNRVEECRPQRVVQIARGKLARLELQIVLNIVRESRNGRRLLVRTRRGDGVDVTHRGLSRSETWRTHTDSGRGTSCGRSAAEALARSRARRL